MDTLVSTLLGSMPGQYAVYASLAVTAASLADLVVPQATAGSKWALPRAALHALALNKDKALAALAARKV